MRDFDKNYDSRKIYCNSKAFEPEQYLKNTNLINSNLTNTNIIAKIQNKILIKVFKIIKFDFNKICKPCIKNK